MIIIFLSLWIGWEDRLQDSTFSKVFLSIISPIIRKREQSTIRSRRQDSLLIRLQAAKNSWHGKEDLSLGLEDRKAKGISPCDLHLTVPACLRRQNKKVCVAQITSLCMISVLPRMRMLGTLPSPAFKLWNEEVKCQGYDMARLKIPHGVWFSDTRGNSKIMINAQHT